MSISELHEIQDCLSPNSCENANLVKPKGNKGFRKRSSLRNIPVHAQPKRARRIEQCPLFCDCLGLAAIENWEMFICDACPKSEDYG